MTRRLLVVAGMVIFCCLLSWGALYVVDSFDDLPVYYNPKEATPLHLLVVWFVALFALWVSSGVASLGITVALGVMIGGAHSNIIYRMLFGPVPDYIPLPLGAYGNLADAMILIAAPLYMGLLFGQYRKKNETLARGLFPRRL